MYRAALGWLAVLALSIFGTSASIPLLIGIVAVIIVCAGGVVKQAEILAHKLGDPYGTLVLTLPVVVIEVALIAALMLGPGDHSTIARDSIMAVSMIILNLVFGMALLAGGGLRYNRAGASAYLTMLFPLLAVAFGLPSLLNEDGTFTSAQTVPIIVLSIGFYAFFLYRQVGAQREDFKDDIVQESTEGDVNVLKASAILIASVVPIVLLAHNLADILDGLGTSAALSGVLIAMIVFLPESLTAFRAARAGEGQRVLNLAHGALVSTVGLTVPVVLLIGLLTGQTVIFGESPINLLLLLVTMMMTTVTLNSPRATPLHGTGHLVLFVIFGLVLFST